jgi:PadR family transcriptional regulator, regulatory protein PadR
MKSISKDLIGAAAIPIILTVLKNGDSYGYEIVQTVKKISKDGIKWKEASIYPVLKRLESQGMIKSYWQMIENERPRRYYTLQPDGLLQLDKNRDEWEYIFSVFKHFWKIAKVTSK